MIKGIIDLTFEVSDRIDNGRTLTDILNAGLDELHECAIEVAIAEGVSKQEPDEDGIVGESVDVILCFLDLIRQADPSLTNEDILKIVNRKLNKWERKHG